MPWTHKQKQIAVMACREAGVDDAARKLILRQIPHAMFKASGEPVSEPSSKSPKLNNRDFEQFMGIIEDRAGGKVLHFSAGYWRDKLASRSSRAGERMAVKIRELAGQLDYDLGGLVWRFSGSRTRDVDQLGPKEAWNLIEALKQMIARKSDADPQAQLIPAESPKQRQQRLFSDRETSSAGSALVHGDTSSPSRRRRGSFQSVSADDIPF